MSSSSGPAGDTLSASAGGSTAQGGTVSVNPDGSFTYTPPPDFAGPDTFTYTVSDASGDYATGTATVTVQPATVAVTVTGSQVLGSSSPQFSFTPPNGVPVTGTVSCATVNGGTAVGPSLPAGSYTIDGSSCTGLSAPSGYQLSYTGGTFTVAPPACTTTITGTHSTQLTVASGVTCLVNATQNGKVTVDSGASLSVTDSKVNGTVTANGAASIAYCGSTEDGTLTVAGTADSVTLGDGASCAADTIPSLITISGTGGPVIVDGLKENGTLTLSGNTGGVDLAGVRLSGRAYVQDNTGTAAITVAGNTINGSLSCTGNTPPPGDNASVNTVTGTAAGQCAGLATR